MKYKRIIAGLGLIAVGILGAASTEPAQAGHLTLVKPAASVQPKQGTMSDVTNFITYTGKCYQSHSTAACYPIYKTVWHACASYSWIKVPIYTECQSGTVYSVRGLYVWGSTATVNGLTGSRSCHVVGSNGGDFAFLPQVCGEHRVTLRYDKVWDGGELVMTLPTPGGVSWVVQQHVNCYDTGDCFGAYVE